MTGTIFQGLSVAVFEREMVRGHEVFHRRGGQAKTQKLDFKLGKKSPASPQTVADLPANYGNTVKNGTPQAEPKDQKTPTN
jgi:hypothetical protein